MREISTDIIEQLRSGKLKPHFCLDMKINGTHYRDTNCDIPIKNLGNDVTGDPFFTNAEALGNDLIGRWSFNEDDGGTSIYDKSGEDTDFTISGTPTWDKGKFGKCLNFKTADYLYGSVDPIGGPLDPDNITVSAWVFLESTPTGVDYVISKATVFSLGIDSSRRPIFEINTTSQDFCTGPTAIPLRTWTNIVGTYNGTAMYVYVNSVLSYVEAHDNAGNIASASMVPVIGTNFDGMIDEVRVYDVAFNQTKVTDLYSRPISAWEIASGMSLSVPGLDFDGTQAAPVLLHKGMVEEGTLYKVTYTISGYVAGGVIINLGGSTKTVSPLSDGTVSLYIYGVKSVNELYEDLTFQTFYSGGNPEFVLSRFEVRPLLWISRDIENEELLTDGLFVEGDESASPWTWGSGWSSPSAGLEAEADIAGGAAGIIEADILTQGDLYRIEVKMDEVTDGDNFYVQLGSGCRTTDIEDAGTYEFYMEAFTSDYDFGIFGDASAEGVVKRVSLMKMGVDDFDEVYHPRHFAMKNLTLALGQIIDRVDIDLLDIDAYYKAIFIEEEDMQGSEVSISLVLLDEDHQPIGEGLSHRFVLFEGSIDRWKANEESINMTLTNQMYNWDMKTLRKYSPTCGWHELGANECPYVGGLICDRTYNSCIQHGVESSFGGFRWLPSIVDLAVWWGKRPDNA